MNNILFSKLTLLVEQERNAIYHACHRSLAAVEAQHKAAIEKFLEKVEVETQKLPRVRDAREVLIDVVAPNARLVEGYCRGLRCSSAKNIAFKICLF